MKKTSKFLSIITIVVAMVALVGCTLMASASSIELATMPASVYNLNDEVSDFAIYVKYDDNTMETIAFTKAKPNGIVISGFDTTTTGTKTATIKYLSFTINFEYTVVDSESGFAAGNGTKELPYEIDTEARLMLLGNEEFAGSYFEITADINIDATELTGLYIISDETYVFTGYIDGNHHKITIITADEKNSIRLFEGIKDVEINDLDIHSEGSNVMIARNAVGNISLKNVNRFGSGHVINSNAGNYFMYAGFSFLEPAENRTKLSNIELIDCNNYCNLTSTVAGDAGYFAAFVGYPYDADGALEEYVTNLTFTNCNNYATLIGQKPGVLIANAIRVVNMFVSNCQNYGAVEYVKSYDAISGTAGNQNTSISQLKSFENSFTYQNYVVKTAEYTGVEIAADKEIILNITDANIATFKVNAYFETHNGGTNMKRHIKEAVFVVDGTTPISTNLYNFAVTSNIVDGQTYVDGKDVNSNSDTLLLRMISNQDMYFFYGIDGTGIDGTEILEGGFKVKNDSTKLLFTVYAYDSNGKLLAVANFDQSKK